MSILDAAIMVGVESTYGTPATLTRAYEGKADTFTFSLISKNWTLYYTREIQTERYVKEAIRLMATNRRLTVREYTESEVTA